MAGILSFLCSLRAHQLTARWWLQSLLTMTYFICWYASNISFINTDPIHKALPSWPNYLPNAPPPNIITLGIKIFHMNLGWGEHSICSTWCQLSHLEMSAGKNKTKLHNLKIENYVSFGGFTEDLSPRYGFSDSSEGLFWGGNGGARIYRSFCKKIQVVGTSRLLLIKENQTSQINELSAFLCMRRSKSLGFLKIFLWWAPYLSRTIILFFSNLNLLRVHHCGWLQRSMACWQATWFFFIPNSPQGALFGVPAVAEGLVASTSFVYCNGRQHSLSTETWRQNSLCGVCYHWGGQVH